MCLGHAGERAGCDKVESIEAHGRQSKLQGARGRGELERGPAGWGDGDSGEAGQGGPRTAIPEDRQASQTGALPPSTTTRRDTAETQHRLHTRSRAAPTTGARPIFTAHTWRGHKRSAQSTSTQVKDKGRQRKEVGADEGGRRSEAGRATGYRGAPVATALPASLRTGRRSSSLLAARITHRRAATRRQVKGREGAARERRTFAFAGRLILDDCHLIHLAVRRQEASQRRLVATPAHRPPTSDHTSNPHGLGHPAFDKPWTTRPRTCDPPIKPLPVALDSVSYSWIPSLPVCPATLPPTKRGNARHLHCISPFLRPPPAQVSKHDTSRSGRRKP